MSPPEDRSPKGGDDLSAPFTRASVPAGQAQEIPSNQGLSMTLPEPTQADVERGKPFAREERYIVIKRKHLTPFMEGAIRNQLDALEVPIVECAVVEADWPEFEAVWQMIEARVSRAALASMTPAPGEVEVEAERWPAEAEWNAHTEAERMAFLQNYCRARDHRLAFSQAGEVAQITAWRALIKRMTPEDRTQVERVDALAKAFCLLDSFAGEGLGHVYGNGQEIEASEVCLELCADFGIEPKPGWWRIAATLSAPAEPSAALSGAVVERAVKAMYESWPSTAASPALAELAGVPLGEVISYERSIEIGGDPSGLRRLARAALSVSSPAVAGGEDREMTDKEALDILATFTDETDFGYGAEIRRALRAIKALSRPAALTTTATASVEVGQGDREYRKTATIRARQWWKIGDHPAVEMASDVTEAIRAGHPVPFIFTMEGGYVVTPGDWIATGIKGEHWAIKPDVFSASYEPVEPVMDFGDAIDPNASHNRRSRDRLGISTPSGEDGHG